MADTMEQKFSFVSDALPPETFSVVSFQGSEGISQPYAFEILLVADDLEIDLEKVLQNRVRLVIHRQGLPDVVYNGILVTFEQQREVDGKALYQACLAPKLWWLSITRHNQIFLDKTVKEIVDTCLKDGGMTDQDYEFRLQGSYAPLDYVCQYGESHLNFLSRWIEREGIYYFFDQTANGEKIIFTDTQIAHEDLPLGKTLYYSPPSGLEASHKSETIQTLTCRRRLTPAGIFLKDYNYRKPSLDLTGSAVVSATGRGQVYTYNEHFRTAEEGNRLAKIRAEALACRREEYQGESSVPFLLPGFTFDLKTHYRESYNQKYLTVEVQHEGNQPMFMLSGFILSSPSAPIGDRDTSPPAYRNTFNAIKASEQFRPEQKADKPRISGTLIAKIDAAGSGQTAELDDQGRYKVVMPFDLSGRRDGKASAWVRMAQPYAGSDHGMHFPLHKGTEVMLTFLDGDPDRPMIAAAVPNPETPSPVSGDNQTMSVIQTAGQNRIAIEDKAGSERILLHAPNQGSYVRIGAPNDPPPADAPSWKGDTMEPDQDQFGMHLYTNGLLDIEATSENRLVLGAVTDTTGGLYVDTVLGADFDTVIGNRMITSAIASQEFSPTKWSYSAADTEIKDMKNELHLHHTALHDAFHRLANTETKVSNLKTALANQKTAITNSYTKAIKTATKAFATRREVAGVLETALGDVTEVIGKKIDTMGHHVFSSGKRDFSTSQSVRLIGNELNTTGKSIENIMSHTHISSQHVLMAGTLNIL